jgi:hypothetical protein
MTAVVRHTKVTNTTGALLTSVPINVGQEYSTISIEWTFSAADVGTAAGQTRDATNPNVGFLFAQFAGAHIKRVFAPRLIKPATVINGTAWDIYRTGLQTPANVTELAFRIVDGVGVSSLYLYDNGSASTSSICQIQAGDKVIVIVELGNT